MRPVCMVAGGVTKFAKAHRDRTIAALTKDAFDYALHDDINLRLSDIDGGIGGYVSDHFNQGLLLGAMVFDRLGLVPKSNVRIEAGGATGGAAFRQGYMAIAAGLMDVCVIYGFEKLSEVTTEMGNEFMAIGADHDFDYPVGGFYTAFYATMANRHMYEFGTTVEQNALVAIKAYSNALHNPYAQQGMEVTVEDILKSPMVATPLTRLMCCLMSDGAAVAILASEERARQITDKPVYVIGSGCGTDYFRTGDRPRGEVVLLPHEDPEWYRGLEYPGVHSFRAARYAALQAYQQAGITNPIEQIDLCEIHDAFTSAEIQTYEDLGLCRYGEGGKFIEEGHSKLGGKVPVNPSGGLLACGHPVGATGIMSIVFAFWQLQETIEKHLGNANLQVKNAHRAVCHSHAGTGAYVVVNILERGH